MTVSHDRPASPDEIDSETVEQFLLKHPDFFQGRPDLLTKLILPHESGAAISLIEHQVAALRAQNKRSELQLQQLISIARDNDRLNENLQRLTLCLMETADINESLVLLTTVLEKDFDAEVIVLYLLSDISRLQLDHAGFRFMDVQFIQPDSPQVSLFESVLSGGEPSCGRFTNEQRVMMFAHRADQVASAALVPLSFRMSYAPEKPALGLLAIGSGDPDRFHYDMGTVFLAYLGELIARTLLPHVQA